MREIRIQRDQHAFPPAVFQTTPVQTVDFSGLGAGALIASFYFEVPPTSGYSERHALWLGSTPGGITTTAHVWVRSPLGWLYNGQVSPSLLDTHPIPATVPGGPTGGAGLMYVLGLGVTEIAVGFYDVPGASSGSVSAVLISPTNTMGSARSP